jgi:hypothetical protein
MVKILLGADFIIPRSEAAFGRGGVDARTVD